MGLFSGITDMLSGRKARKEANRAGGEILRDTEQYFDQAYGRITPYLEPARERSNIAGAGLTNALNQYISGDYGPSENALNTIRDLSTQATEQAAATGRSQSGGLQGELERIRTGTILQDEQNQRANQINMLRTLSPFAQEPLQLEGILADMDLDKLQRITASRRNQLADVTSAIGSQFKGIGSTLDAGAKALGAKFGMPT